MNLSDAPRNADLDPSFAGGIVDLQRLLPAGMQLLAAGPCLVLQDGGVLVGAALPGPNGNSALITPLLMKLTTDGTLDRSFGNDNGYVIAEEVVAIESLRQLESGTIVVGLLFENSETFEMIPLLIGYLPDGTPDDWFNGGQLLITQLPNFNPAAVPATQPPPPPTTTAHHAILLAFRHRDMQSSTERDYMIQVTALGELDLAFQQTGYTRVAYAPDVFMRINAFDKRSDGTILVAGQVNQQGALALLTADGAIDSTFGDRGFLLIEDGTQSELTGLFVTAGDTIRVIGRRLLSGKQRWDEFVRGYDANGVDEAGFTTTYRHYEGDFGAGFGAIASTPTDNYLWCLSNVWRFSGGNLNAQILMSRLLPNGQPDDTFGEDGYWLIPDTYLGRGFAVQNDLKCIVVVQNQQGSGVYFTAHRYLGSPPAQPPHPRDVTRPIAQ
ncbi:hypothetical protein LZ023_21760 [Pseudomonas silvicola]|nr:hypothetical protein LZ023_21760 [Pseudomonas silvicola]